MISDQELDREAAEAGRQQAQELFDKFSGAIPRAFVKASVLAFHVGVKQALIDGGVENVDVVMERLGHHHAAAFTATLQRLQRGGLH